MTQNTLPAWLKKQALARPNQIAIRHKQLGVWHEKSWHDIDQEIVLLSNLLKLNGFGKGDTVFLLSHPRPEAVFIAVAAQLAGGVAATLDPATHAVDMEILFRELQPTFIFAEAQFQVEQVLAHAGDAALIIYADKRGLAQIDHRALKYYSQIILDAGNSINHHVVESETYNCNDNSNDNGKNSAFIFYRLNAQQQIEQQSLSHSDMLSHGQQLIQQQQLTSQEQALAARAFAASGHMRYLLAPWLLAGFTLNFPENIDTRDLDRRELGPTLVVGTRETYQRLHRLVETRFPHSGSFRKRLIDWALDSAKENTWLRKFFADFLILRPLRDVIGFTRTRTPLLAGNTLPRNTADFFSALGIEIRQLPDINEWMQRSAASFETAAHFKKEVALNDPVGLAV